MNAGLRVRHRRMVTVLGVVSAAVLVAAVLARPTFPTMAEIPLAPASGVEPGAAVLAGGQFMLQDVPIEASVYAAAPDGRAPRVMLRPLGGKAVSGADVLVYWHPREGERGMRVPDGAWLIGTLAGPQARVFELPFDAVAGELLFYSLAQQRMYDRRWALPQAPRTE